MEIKQMKNLFGVAMALVAVGSTAANADYSDKKFRNEIGAGLDLVSAEVIYEDVIDAAPGELGQEVYEYKNAVKNDVLMFFDYPCDEEVLNKLKQSVCPSSVHYMNYQCYKIYPILL